MKDAVTRSTIYFEPDLHRALRLKAAHTQSSLSHLVNEIIVVVVKVGKDVDRRSQPLVSADGPLRSRR